MTDDISTALVAAIILAQTCLADEGQGSQHRLPLQRVPHSKHQAVAITEAINDRKSQL